MNSIKQHPYLIAISVSTPIGANLIRGTRWYSHLLSDIEFGRTLIATGKGHNTSVQHLKLSFFVQRRVVMSTMLKQASKIPHVFALVIVGLIAHNEGTHHRK
jgi:hypothetical protein